MRTQPTPDLDGLVRLRCELLDDGLTDNQIARLVRTKVLHRVRHGAYVHAEAWEQLTPEDQHRVRCRAVLRTAHPTTVLTHLSSVVERGVPAWGLSLDVVHTTQRVRGKAGRRSRDWTPHRGRLADSDVEVLGEVEVSVAPRAAVEVCSIATVETSLVVVNGLLRAGATTLEEIAEHAERCRLWPGSLTTDLVLRLADPRSESIGEDRLAYLCYRQALPKPVLQLEVYDEAGSLLARLDFAWPEHGVWLEFDGKVKYERFRRDGESLDEFLMREKQREEQIGQLTGWTCIRVSWADLAQPERLAARIRRILAARASRAAG